MFLIQKLRCKVKGKLLTILALVSSICAFSVDITNVNMVHKYNDLSEVSLDYTITQLDNELDVYLTFEFSLSRKNFLITYGTQPNYRSENALTDSIQLNQEESDLYQIHRQISYDKQLVDSLLVIKVKSIRSGADFYFDIPLLSNLFFGHSDILIKSKWDSSVLHKQYLKPNDSAYFHISTQDSVSVYYYSTDFPPALPPMALESNNSGDQMIIDDVFTNNSGERIILKEGLYFAQTDTLSNEGIGFLYQNNYYPKLVNINKIYEPVRYLSTGEEWLRFEQSTDYKETFDRFWLNMVRSKQQAKFTIKKFYDRVERANLFFTSHKQGWKTDRGMIYIIFGRPDSVIKTGAFEKWVYNNLMSSGMDGFTFYKTKNLFSNESYVLDRSENYRRLWLKTLELWRTGKI